MSREWPPRIIFNTDGHWVANYQDRFEPEDITQVLPVLAEAGVDALSVLVGIDDDPAWRGSPHGQMWGDNIENWSPDPFLTDIHGHPLKGGMPTHYHGRPIKPVEGKDPMSAHEFLHWIIAKVIEDGHELMDIYIEGARKNGMLAFASFRMSDAHSCDEARGWYGRAQQKIDRPDLLIGSPVPREVHGAPWSFSWRWDWAKEEVRQRYLGLADEAISRYEFDGLELDFSRAPPFFRDGENFKNIPVMTQFMRDVRSIVEQRSKSRGREIRLVVRVPVGIGENLEAGLDTETWIREGLADIVVMGSPGYCVHEIDIEEAVSCAGDSGVLIFTGFDGHTYAASPQEGYEVSPSGVLRAAALNGYYEGASGVHLFNYDYPGHRGEKSQDDNFNVYQEHHLAVIGEFRDPAALEQKLRCYYLPAPPWGGGGYSDHRLQVPRKLALIGRGAGPEHAMRITIREDVEGGKASGRIGKTELRLRMTDFEESRERIRFEINGKSFPFKPDRTVANSRDESWLVFDDPPLFRGVNRILLNLEGASTPIPWPRVENCEILVFPKK